MFFVKTRHNVSFLIKGLLVATAFGALTACSEEKKAEAPEIVRPVKVTEVAAADHGRRLQYSGSVKARTEMNLGFRVAGKITERLVDVGQRVRPGLARRRAETLAEKSISSQSQFEQAQLANDQAISQRESAQSALDQARNQVAYTELKSDQNGIVTTVSADIGQVVASGTPVLSVAVEGSKEVQIAVPEMDVAQFKPGKTVKARFWSATDLVLDGKLREVAGSADAQSRTFAVRVSLPDDPRVLLGMTATIEADEDNAVATYAVPLAALSKKDGQSVVWIVDRGKGTVSSRAVKVADFSDDGVRVAEGIAKGDLVVSAGTQFMKEDMKVKLPEAIASRFGSVSSLTTASLAP
jgi:multidrug efflux system membrane fusion protein